MKKTARTARDPTDHEIALTGPQMLARIIHTAGP
jgi:hypothetical protein